MRQVKHSESVVTHLFGFQTHFTYDRPQTREKTGLSRGTTVAQLTLHMERADIEHIARLVLTDYGVHLKLRAVSIVQAGRCTVGFSDGSSPATTVSVPVWCDAKASPYGVRESLKKGLQIPD
jgi:hypothetical protein